MDIVIDLSHENTEEKTARSRYNLDIIVPLDDLWEYLISPKIDYARIQVQTTVGMPVIIDAIEHRVDVTLNDLFKMIEVEDKKIQQHGFIEGLYDATRPIAIDTQIWKYDVLPLEEVE